MKWFKIVLGIAFIVFIGSTFLLWKMNQPPSFGGDFSLLYRGNAWSFSDTPKELNLLYFGYTKCPDVCPLTLSFTGNAFKQLSPSELDKIRLIFLSVDPEHDEPNQVADFATNFFPNFIGLSGSKNQIEATVQLFAATYSLEKDPKSYLGYTISHTDRVFFLNENGKVIDTVLSPRNANVVLDKIREHL